MMRHSPIWGHLPLLGALMAGLPSDVHGDDLLLFIQNNWRTLFPNCKRCPPVAYVDTWPFTPPLLISLHPSVTAQFTQEVSRVKPPEQKRFMYPVTKNMDLTSYEGAEWKVWRKRLNPGFSNAMVTARLPDLLEEVDVLVDMLREKAGKDGSWSDVFQFEEKAVNLTFDVMGRYLLDIRLHEQTGPPTPLKTGLLDSLRRLRFYTNILNIWGQLSPFRWLRFRRNARRMDAFLLPHIHARIAAKPTTKAEKNQFLQLTVQSLQDEVESKTNGVDYAAFVANALGHTKFFLFAGHDTTAGAICWTLRYLSLNPGSLAKLRAELDTVLGPDAAAALRANPHLINALTYAAAVLKESLRLQANVGTMRQGGAGFSLVAPADSEFAGMTLPTERCVVWDGNWAIHRNPEFWHRVEEFLPERWLVTDENDPLYPPRNAFRAFELGPRDCIGQFLAQVEMKAVLALVVREFEFREDWEAWDEKNGLTGKNPDVVLGERAYQVHEPGSEGPPHVKDRFPVRVRLRSEGKL